MESRYFKEWSPVLNRDMEFKIWGKNGGKLLFAFAPMDGRFYDFEDNGMVECIADYVEAGKITVVEVDSLDQESWTAKYMDGRTRAFNQERWFAYVTDELLPRAYEITGSTGKAMTTGCSMGGIHAANFYFRRPDLFDTVIALSGTYDAAFFWDGYDDELVYENSPARFLLNMEPNHPYMKMYAEGHIMICIGQGAWEDELLPGTRELDRVLKLKGIPSWVDYWGFDVNHDWPWWRKQLPYFLGTLEL